MMKLDKYGMAACVSRLPSSAAVFAGEATLLLLILSRAPTASLGVGTTIAAAVAGGLTTIMSRADTAQRMWAGLVLGLIIDRGVYLLGLQTGLLVLVWPAALLILIWNIRMIVKGFGTSRSRGMTGVSALSLVLTLAGVALATVAGALLVRSPLDPVTLVFAVSPVFVSSGFSIVLETRADSRPLR